MFERIGRLEFLGQLSMDRLKYPQRKKERERNWIVKSFDKLTKNSSYKWT